MYHFVWGHMSVLQDVANTSKKYTEQNVVAQKNGCQKVFGRLLIYFNLIAAFFSGALAVGKYAWDASKFQCHRNEQRK